jgi:hypothetical protein
MAAVAAADSFRPRWRNRRAARAQRPPQTTSHDVYFGGRWLGRDPDPNVRFEILRTQNWRRG